MGLQLPIYQCQACKIWLHNHTFLFLATPSRYTCNFYKNLPRRMRFQILDDSFRKDNNRFYQRIQELLRWFWQKLTLYFPNGLYTDKYTYFTHIKIAFLGWKES